MPKKVPAKNIEPILIDVKRPDFNYDHLRKAKLNLAYAPQKPSSSKRPKIIFWGAAILVLAVLALGAGLIVFNLNSVKRGLALRGENIFSNFSDSIAALQGFKPNAAVSSLAANSAELDSLNDFFGVNQSQSLIGMLGKFIPALKDAGSFLGQVTALNFNFLNLSADLADLQANGFRYFQTDGQSLLGRLNNMRQTMGDVMKQIEAVRNTTASLKNTASFFGKVDDVLDKDYLKYSADLYAWDKFLGAAIGLLSSPTDRRILLLFQNPAELRPGGGFDGSYADVTVRNGQMQTLDVKDIYDPDGQLDLKVIPPKPLQGLTRDWGARDANWFFDFPTSARTVLDFMEQSKMYSEKNVTFDAVIALNINVLQGFLEITGPIDMPDYDLAINQNNFLNEIQREVEAGKDKAAGYPKRILQVLTPKILEKLNNFSEAETAQFMENLKTHLAQKDIMFYAKDPALANLLSANDWDGSVYDLPGNFWGNYLAVVNANIAGGKSDVFVNQTLTVDVNIDTDGGIFTDLTVERFHAGNTQKDPWWRATNQNFFQVYVNPGAALFSIKGNDAKPLPKGSDYADYSVNPDLAAMESTMSALSNYNAWTMSAFGKKVFAGWLSTPAGQTKTLNVRYQTPASSEFVLADGSVYQFVFDRQSGALNSSLNLAINAPLGYVWDETKMPVWNYTGVDPVGRLILNLTLKKIDL